MKFRRNVHLKMYILGQVVYENKKRFWRNHAYVIMYFYNIIKITEQNSK